MSRRSSFAIVALCLLGGCVLYGCGGIPAASPATSTPVPTYTPMPTYTPVPTYTPAPTYTPEGAVTAAASTTADGLVTAAPVAQYTPWPTPAPWPTPTPIPGVPDDVEYYVQELEPYVDYMVYGLQAMEQALYAYSDGYITIEDVDATLEIYNEIVLTAYEGALAAIPPETIAMVADEIVNELADVQLVLDAIESLPLDQWTPDELQQTLAVLEQVRGRTQLVDGAFSEGLASFGSGEHPQLGDLQLQLPERGELSLPSRLGEGRSGTGRPGLQDTPGELRPDRPDIDRPGLPQPERPEIEKPSLPSRGRR